MTYFNAAGQVVIVDGSGMLGGWFSSNVCCSRGACLKVEVGLVYELLFELSTGGLWIRDWSWTPGVYADSVLSTDVRSGTGLCDGAAIRSDCGCFDEKTGTIRQWFLSIQKLNTCLYYYSIFALVLSWWCCGVKYREVQWLSCASPDLVWVLADSSEFEKFPNLEATDEASTFQLNPGQLRS